MKKANETVENTTPRKAMAAVFEYINIYYNHSACIRRWAISAQKRLRQKNKLNKMHLKLRQDQKHDHIID